MNDNLHDSVQGTVSGPPPQLYQPEFQKQLIEQQKQAQAQLEQQKQQQLEQQVLEQQQMLEKQKQQLEIREQQLQQQLQQQHLQQQIISSTPSQPLYYQPIVEQPNVVYQPQPQQQSTSEASYPQQQQQQITDTSNVLFQQQQQPPVQEQQQVVQPPPSTSVVYQQPPHIVEQPSVIYQQQQQQQPILEQVYQPQPVLEQPNLVYQHQQMVDPQGIILQQQQVDTQNVLFPNAPTVEAAAAPVLYTPADVAPQQPVQYIPVVVPLEPQQPQQPQQQPPLQVEAAPAPAPAIVPPLPDQGQAADPFTRKILEMQTQLVVASNEAAAASVASVPAAGPVLGEPPLTAPQIDTGAGAGEAGGVAGAAISPAAPSHSEGGQERDKVSCVLSQFGQSACAPPHNTSQPALPFLKLDLSSASGRQLATQQLVSQLEDAAAAGSGWRTAPVIVTSDMAEAGRVSRRGSLPVAQLGSLLAPPPRSGLGSGAGPGQPHMKAHSAESSPKRISGSLSVSTYSNIAHKLPFPSQSLRRRSADPSELLSYSRTSSASAGSQRASPAPLSSLTAEDVGLLTLLEHRRASGSGSGLPPVLSPVWEGGCGLAGQYNMMTIREVMSLCGSTTSLASTQVTASHHPGDLLRCYALCSPPLQQHNTKT